MADSIIVPPSKHNLNGLTNNNDNGPARQPIQIETFNSFPVKKVHKFDILVASHVRPSDFLVSISSPILGPIDKQIDWLAQKNSNNNNNNNYNSNKCQVSFRAPIVGIYTINAEIINQPQFSTQLQAKAYDLSKVFINSSSETCYVNESYEFSVDASEAGEGQLEIAVNEGEIPNQVQVLDNGKCIVNFIPEDILPHVVDIKFNGHNVNGCPFVVEVTQRSQNMATKDNAQQSAPSTTLGDPMLIKEERILVDTPASFSITNIRFGALDKNDILIIDPESQAVDYKLIEDHKLARYQFELLPSVVGDYTVELKGESELSKKLPSNILEQFPFPIKVFDFTKVIVSDVTDGVVGQPIYFFIDASQAGSGNLEIRVSSKTRNVPNYPQSEANAKIRVNFTPTEAVDHSIDVKFNGIPVPGNPFLVKVALYPQARLPVPSQDLLKYVAIDELVSFYVDYIGIKEDRGIPVDGSMERNCQAYVLKPDFVHTKLTNVEFEPADKNDKHARFKINFTPNKIGPHKLFITVNNELLPGSPIISNVYNINEVRVSFAKTMEGESSSLKPIGHVNKPVTFTVDASRAGEGTLALAVVSGISRSPVQTDVQVSDKGHGLYNLTFIPTEFSPHSIDMSFNDRVVPRSPFIVDILDANGKSFSNQQATLPNNENNLNDEIKRGSSHQQMIQNFEAMSLKHQQQSPQTKQKSQAPGRTASTNKKSLAYGLVNATNIIYLELGILDSSKNQVSLIGPNSEKVPFNMAKGSPQPGESKKPYIEYKPKSIGKLS